MSSVTYNADPLTPIAEEVAGTTGVVQCVSLWYMLAPDVGSHDVVITWAGDVLDRYGGAVSMFHASQEGPDSQDTSSLTSTPQFITTTVTTTVDGAWTIDAVGSGNPNAFASNTAGQTERYDEQASSSAGAGSTNPVSLAGATQMAWSQNANRLAHVVASFKPITNVWSETSRTPDQIWPGDWDPDETLTLDAILEPAQASGTSGTVVVATPNGVVAAGSFSRP